MSPSFRIFECPLLVTKVNLGEVPPSRTSLIYKVIVLLFSFQLLTCSESVLSKPGYPAPTDSWFLSSSKNPSKAPLVTESFFSLNRIVHHKPTTTSWLNPKTCQVQVNHPKLLPLTIPLDSQGHHKVGEPDNQGCGRGDRFGSGTGPPEVSDVSI